MVEKRQFTIRFLLLETLLIAVAMALGRWLYLSMNRNSITPDVEQALEIVAFPLIAILVGAIIGGFFRRWLDGAILGFVMLLPAIFLFVFLFNVARR